VKLNELKQPKNEAIDWSPLIGHYGQSFMGDTPAGQDREGKMAKNIFVRNFMQKAISGLASAINSGLVDPNVTGAAPTTQQPQAPAPAAPVTGVGNKPNTMANAPVSKTNTAKPGNPNLAPAATEKSKGPQGGDQTNLGFGFDGDTGLPFKSQDERNAGLAKQKADKIAATRQNKQAAATQVARAGMTPVRKPVVWKSGRNPTAPAVARENTTFDILNKIFEGILNVNEAAGQSISQYIQGLFMQYMKGVPMNDPNTTQQVKALADNVQATYAKDNGKNALTKLADLGWALSHSPEATQQAAAAQQTTPAAAQQTNPAAAQQTTPAAVQQPNPAADQQSMVGVRQINKIIPTLRKRDLLSVKKTVDNTLAGRGGAAVAPTTAPVAAPTATPPATDNIVKMPKGKVRAAREGGVTPEEQAKFDQRVQQAMANQK
jgi:hypothetical protein